MPVRYGRYELLERLAAGGMGEIFLARLSSGRGFQKLVAIKRMLPHLSDNPQFERMFCDEAAVAARLSHGCVVQVFDFGEVDQSYFLAMEFVHGADLRSLLLRAEKTGKPLGFRHTIEIGQGLCRGLDYLHRLTADDGTDLKLVHRDVSPPNVMISFEGEVKLTDFGLAKARLLTEETSGGKLKGKFSYMSPEQVEGRALDRRSDLFSLGAVLYEAAAGEKAFPVLDDVRETLSQITEAPTEPPSSRRAGIPEALDAVILKCLEKDPDRRYQTASEMNADLARIPGEATDRDDDRSLAEYLRELFPERATPPSATIEPTLVSPRPIVEGDASRANRAIAEPPAGTADIVFPRPERKRRQRMLTATLVGLVLLAAATATLITLLWTPLGRLKVDSVPAGAAVLVDGVHRGTTPARLEDLPVEQALLIRIEQAGFRAFEEVVILERDEEQLIEARLYPFTGTAVVSSVPQGATVEIDGRDTGKRTPTELTGLSLGWKHKVRLTLPGYEPWEQEFSVQSTDPLSLSGELEGLPGSVHVESAPPGAEIFIDGKSMEQRTPATIEELPGGKQVSLRLVRRGYRPWQETVVPQGGGEIKRRARLTALGALLWMSWQPTSNPRYELSLDGRKIGPEAIGEVPLRPGAHLLRLEHKTGRRKLSFTLRLIVPETGKQGGDKFRANIDAHPWAKVDLNGRRIGQTPISRVRLPPGEHLILIKRKWVVPLEVKLKIEPEQ